jgi:hypothetical protein
MIEARVIAKSQRVGLPILTPGEINVKRFTVFYIDCQLFATN